MQRQCLDAFSYVMTAWICAVVAVTWCVEVANMLKNAASYAQIFVMRVQKNVKNTVMQYIAKHALKHAENVPRNAVTWHNFFLDGRDVNH